jgi:hypothetical protein
MTTNNNKEMSLREEIYNYIWTFDHIKEEKFAIDECHLMTDTIIKLIEKRIDSIMQREITDSHHFEIQQRKNDLSTTDAIVRICREIKEMLK